MKKQKIISGIVLAIIIMSAGLALAADQRIQYTEEMVGAGHPTKADTMNRLTLVEHDTDGTHKNLTIDGQITFPAIQSASTGANTLDDYEEGTYTPALAFGGASVGVTYLAVGGSYTKIGRVCFFTAWIQLSAKGSSTGAATVSLPFTVINNSGYRSPCSIYFSTVTYSGQVLALPTNNQAIVAISQITEEGSVTALTHANFSNTSVIVVSGFYVVA